MSSSKTQIYKFDYSHLSSDIDGNSQFDYEPVEFDYHAIPFGVSEPFTPKPLPEEHTLVMVKPCAMKFNAEIIKRIKDEGFTILKTRIIQLTPEIVSVFFNEHYGKAWFPKIVLKLSRGPVMIMALAKDNAIEDFKDLMGPPRVSIARKFSPFSLRALYGLKGDFATNGIHGSANRIQALREIHFFFPQAIPEPLSSVMEAIDYYKERFHFLLIKSLGELYKYKTDNLLTWLTNWLEKHNPELPKMKITYPSDFNLNPPTPMVVKKKCHVYY